MILKNQSGIITNYRETQTKAGKPMLILSHTQGNSDKLGNVFVFDNNEDFNALSIQGEDLIGRKIQIVTEILDNHGRLKKE